MYHGGGGFDPRPTFLRALSRVWVHTRARGIGQARHRTPRNNRLISLDRLKLSGYINNRKQPLHPGATVDYLCTATSNNKKTGNVPTIWIGGTRAESLQSCRDVGCPLLHKKHGGQGGGDNPICYAQSGTPSFAHSSMCKANKRGKDYSLKRALTHASRAARMVRLGSIGDPAALSPLDGAYIREAVKREGLALIGYTHGWALDMSRRWKGSIMASCDTLAQADQAIADGWRATVVLPSDHTERTFTTPDGHTGVVCPAILKPELVLCNTCRLCDGSKAGPVIGFPDHGPGAK